MVVSFMLPFLPMVQLQQLAHANYSLSPADENKLMRFQVSPGSEIKGSVILTNTSRQAHEMHLQVLDGAKTNSGGFAISQEDTPQKNIGVWTQLKTPLLTLKGRAKKPIEFTIKIPSDTPPGTYAGGIIAQEVKLEKQGNIVTSVRSVIPLYVIVPGKISTKKSGGKNIDTTKELVSKLQWTSFTHTFTNNKHLFLLDLANTGQTALAIKINITIESFWGLKKIALPEKEIFLYKDEKITVRLPAENMPSGSFSANANITYSLQDLVNNTQKPLDQINKKIEFSAEIPYSTIAIIFIAAIVTILIVIIMIRVKPLQR